MMSVAALVGRLALVGVLAPAFQQGGHALAWFSSQHVVPAPQASIEPNVAIANHFLRAVQVVQSIPNMLQCEKLAHSTLMETCSTYDRRRDSEFQSTTEAVETYRDIFAIQMTTCEVENAQQDMPFACEPLLQPLSRDPRHDISDCKAALYNLPQHWTSYEHNKDRGQLVCYTMRSDIDRDNQLEIIKGLFSAVKGMGLTVEEHFEVMEQIKREAQNLNSELRKAFVALEDENKQIKAEIRQSFSNVAEDMSAMNKGVKSLLGSVGQVDQDLQHHVNQVNHFFARIMSLTTDLEGMSTGVAVVRQDFEELQAKMQMQYQQYLEDIFKKALELSADMDRANQGVGSLASKVDHINNGIQDSFSKLQRMNTAAVDTQDKLHHMQTQMEDIQFRTNHTRETMQMMQEHVDRVLPFATSASSALDGLASSLVFLKHFGVQYAMATGLVLFAVSLLGFKLLNALFISSFLGIGIAYYIMPPLILLVAPAQPAEADVQDQSGTNSMRQLNLFTAAALMSIGAVVKTAFDNFKKRRSIEYDPESPPRLPITEK